MAIAYLNDGATSLAAANWSDAAGFGAAATLVINSGTQSIQSGLDQSASSIEYLDILEGFSGTIGGAAGALKCDADGTAESAATIKSRIRYWASGGALYFDAAGGTALAHYVQIKTGGRYYGVGGLQKNVHLEQGEAFFAAGVTATGGVWHFDGGSGTIDYHATNVIPSLFVMGGAHSLKRNATTLYVGGGTVTIDCQALSITTVNQYGGRVNLINCGDFTTYNGFGGVLDASRLGRAVSLGTANLGAPSSFTLIRSTLLTAGTKNPIGSYSFT